MTKSFSFSTNIDKPARREDIIPLTAGGAKELSKYFKDPVHIEINLKETEIRERILKKIKKWNKSGYMSDCLGCYWEELLNIIKTA